MTEYVTLDYLKQNNVNPVDVEIPWTDEKGETHITKWQIKPLTAEDEIELARSAFGGGDKFDAIDDVLTRTVIKPPLDKGAIHNLKTKFPKSLYDNLIEKIIDISGGAPGDAIETLKNLERVT